MTNGDGVRWGFSRFAAGAAEAPGSARRSCYPLPFTLCPFPFTLYPEVQDQRGDHAALAAARAVAEEEACRGSGSPASVGGVANEPRINR